MAGIVYLRTNRFEVKLEGITFKAKDFESMCSIDFLFPEGKIWARAPVVGIDVMRHPRDPSIVLMLLCIGVGCLIIRFNSGDILPEPIYKFLTDDRIHFVGFGIPEKKDIFPFQELGLTKNKADIGYLAAKYLDNPKYKRYELAGLACKVLKIKSMIGLTQASSFKRHEQIKCSICQLFITCTIAMTLLGKNDKKKIGDGLKKSSFLKNLNSLPLFNEGWFKISKIKKEMNHVQKGLDLPVQTMHIVDESDGYDFDTVIDQEEPCPNIPDDFIHISFKNDIADYESTPRAAYHDDNQTRIKCSGGRISNEDQPNYQTSCNSKRPLKGILKCSANRECLNQTGSGSMKDTPPSGSLGQESGKSSLKRANSKGCNVAFKCSEVMPAASNSQN